MVTCVNSTLPAALGQSYSITLPLVVVVAFDLGYLLIQAAKSLIGRVQPIGNLHKEGCVDFQNELYEEAIEKFTLALKCEPDQNKRGKILADRALAYLANEKPENAQDDIQLALTYDIEEGERFQPLFFLCQGSIFTKNKEDEKAIASYTKALNSNPHEPKIRADILYQRGYAYCRQKKFELCEIDITEAISYGEDKAQLFGARAVARVALKKYPEAIQDISAALCHSIDEKWKAELLYLRAVAYQKNENPDLARQDWETALKCNFTKEGLHIHKQLEESGFDCVLV